MGLAFRAASAGGSASVMGGTSDGLVPNCPPRVRAFVSPSNSTTERPSSTPRSASIFSKSSAPLESSIAEPLVELLGRLARLRVHLRGDRPEAREYRLAPLHELLRHLRLLLAERVQPGLHARPLHRVLGGEPRDDEQVHVGQLAGELGGHVGHPPVLERALVGQPLGQLLVGLHLLLARLVQFVLRPLQPLVEQGEQVRLPLLGEGAAARTACRTPAAPPTGAPFRRSTRPRIVSYCRTSRAGRRDLDVRVLGLALQPLQLALLAGVRGRLQVGDGAGAVPPLLEDNVHHVEPLGGQRLPQPGEGEPVLRVVGGGGEQFVDDAHRHLRPPLLHREDAAGERVDPLRQQHQVAARRRRPRGWRSCRAA